MRTILPGPLGLVTNSAAVRAEPYARQGRDEVLSLAALATAENEIVSWPGYCVTPLISLPGLADAARVASVYYKDEGGRFGLGSFKALGGAYAVMRYLQKMVEKRTGSKPSSAALARGEFRHITSELTVTCATDGNHGKSVAWGASTFGCNCIIYVHSNVSTGRREAIRSKGAEVREAPGTYDDAVRQAAKDAELNGWQVVSDTSYEGYTEIPKDVMQGYGLIAQEASVQYPDGVVPTHIFVQGGVGGLAASLCAWFWESLGSEAPKFIVVEPDRADCLQLSAAAGKPTAAHGSLDTIMAGLACGEVSLIAWQILSHGTDAFLTVTDEAAAATMRLLAASPYGDPSIVAGESAVAGLAGFILAVGQEELRSRLGIDAESVVMVVGTEGATDPVLYEQIVGKRPDQVLATVTSLEAVS